MTNKDILFLDQTLPNISPPNMKGWFNYAVQETIQRAAAKAISIRAVIAPKEKMAEYQDKLQGLQKKYAAEDEYGEPIMEVTDLGGGRQLEKYDIPDLANPKGKFNLAAKGLAKKYKTSIDEYNTGLEFLEEENKDFEPFWIEPNMIPDGLFRDEMKAVFMMIKKDAEKKA